MDSNLSTGVNLKIDQETVITLRYQLFAVEIENPSQKTLVEERSGDDPLDFLYGQGVVLDKVEDFIKDQSSGFRGTVKIHPTEAFGLYREDLKLWMDRSQFPKDMELQLGMKFQTQGPSGQLLSVIVKEIQDEKVLIDGNHPLAGLALEFDLEILRVRKATPEEVRQKEVLKVLH